MKLFIKRIGLVVGIFLLVFVLIVVFNFEVVGNQYGEIYNAALIDKINRLENIDSPRILLTGNSNVAFGFKSSLIEEHFNMPVINLGLHAALGNAFCDNIAKQYVQGGDIVIVMHTEYNTLDLGDYKLALATMEHNRYMYNIPEKKAYFGLFKAFPNYIIQSSILWLFHSGNRLHDDTSYTRRAFNEYGDVEFKPDTNRTPQEELFHEGTLKIPTISDECIDYLNGLNDYINDKGAVMVVAAYPIASGEYTPKKEEYEVFQEELESKLNCEVISNFTDYYIPYEYFYDSIVHLTGEGAVIRSQLLISDIENSGLLNE